jgi:hypothetical protein
VRQQDGIGAGNTVGAGAGAVALHIPHPAEGHPLAVRVKSTVDWVDFEAAGRAITDVQMATTKEHVVFTT